MLAVSFGVVHNELETANAILKKWQERIALLMDREGAPPTGMSMQDFEAGPWAQEFVAELRVVAGKCEVLSEALATGLD